MENEYAQLNDAEFKMIHLIRAWRSYTFKSESSAIPSLSYLMDRLGKSKTNVYRTLSTLKFKKVL